MCFNIGKIFEHAQEPPYYHKWQEANASFHLSVMCRKSKISEHIQMSKMPSIFEHTQKSRFLMNQKIFDGWFLTNRKPKLAYLSLT